MRLWKMTLCLVVLLGSSITDVSRAEWGRRLPSSNARPPGLFGSLFTPPARPAVKKTTPRTNKEKPVSVEKEKMTQPVSVVEKKGGDFDKVNTLLEQEQQEFLRRLAVCDKLREIALTTKDEELLRKAEQLQERAWNVCQQRMNEVPTTERSALDVEVLTERLAPAPGNGSNRFAPTSRSTGNSGNDRPSRILAQEDRR